MVGIAARVREVQNGTVRAMKSEIPIAAGNKPQQRTSTWGLLCCGMGQDVNRTAAEASYLEKHLSFPFAFVCF